MLDWYHRIIHSKYCKNSISQGYKKKFMRGNPFKNKVPKHMRKPNLFEVYPSTYAKI